MLLHKAYLYGQTFKLESNQEPRLILTDGLHSITSLATVMRVKLTYISRKSVLFSLSIKRFLAIRTRNSLLQFLIASMTMAPSPFLSGLNARYSCVICIAVHTGKMFFNDVK